MDVKLHKRSSQASREKKILLIGPSGSGKTTICKVVFKGKHFSSTLASIAPTINVERKEYRYRGKRITVFDTGGKKVYWDQYFTNLRGYLFSDVASMVFVVDASNSDMDEFGKEFLDKTLHLLRKDSPHAKAYIVANKTDLASSPTALTSRLEHLQEYLLSDIKYPVTFLTTSVSEDPYQARETFERITKEAWLAIPMLSISFQESIRDLLKNPKKLDEIRAFLRGVTAAFGLFLCTIVPVDERWGPSISFDENVPEETIKLVRASGLMPIPENASIINTQFGGHQLVVTPLSRFFNLVMLGDGEPLIEWPERELENLVSETINYLAEQMGLE